MARAVPADVASRLGRPLTPDESTQAATLLNDAELLIRSRIKNLDELITAGQIDPGIVVMVEANAVMRVVRNPEAMTGEVDGSYSYQLNWKEATGRLEIMDYEWSLLGVTERVFLIHPRLPWPPLGARPEPQFWRDV
ncbi:MULTISPECIES: Gp19/Gp15/Gp42 family protein [Nocardia]|uniref:Phage Gp19/Gp15/Gp42 family protein n=1 Tax=Nocardia iowensis TaxID=204891 RepID=A0ABX8RUJ9_NOCIO|nr:Gp19/Gp15/Gp42 family protein [Nocardia iowensis]QXN92569.1 phage Gp19/Gp15/Gp42 family protein [Nocardia iowensis]